MGLRQCDKCSEMVDEAKAFCPGCGNAFVAEEKRGEASKFDKLDPTFQFGPTVYNQMLEDMGLNISSAPNPNDRRVEVLAPIATEPSPQPKAKASVPLSVSKPPDKIQEKRPAKTHERTPSSNAKWYILIGVAVIILLPIALASAIFLVLDIWSRLQ